MQKDLSKKMESIDFLVDPTYKPLPVRCDIYLTQRFSGRSRSSLQKIFKEKRVLVNHKEVSANYKIRGGETVQVLIGEDVEYIAPENIDFDVIMEDVEMMAINKSPGIMMHPAGGVLSGTLLNAIHHHFEKKGEETRPGLLQRLDKHTSGLLVVAKTKNAHAKLQDQLLGHSLDKIYLAICTGCPEQEEGFIEASLDEVFHPFVKKMGVSEEGKSAKTEYKVLAKWDDQSLVAVKLHTGRQHQIRVHFSHIGHPLIGDTLYGGEGPFPRQALHSYFLRFLHPEADRETCLYANCPKDFQFWFKDLPEPKFCDANLDLNKPERPWDPLSWLS